MHVKNLITGQKKAAPACNEQSSRSVQTAGNQKLKVMNKEYFKKVVLDQLTDEYLMKLASDVINNSHLHYYIIIDNDGIVWVTYSLFFSYSSEKLRYRRNGEEYENMELLVITLPCYRNVDIPNMDVNELKQGLAEVIKARVISSIERVPADYWD